MTVGQTLHVLDPLAGHVIVLATADDESAGRWLRELEGLELFVAMVTPGAASPGESGLAFRADASAVATWERVAPQIEQRLGPVDVVLADAHCVETLRQVFDADLGRRGRHGVVVPAPADDPVRLLRSLLARTR